jgi:energy-converting hydrogenase Eha subunit E
MYYNKIIPASSQTVRGGRRMPPIVWAIISLVVVFLGLVLLTHSVLGALAMMVAVGAFAGWCLMRLVNKHNESLKRRWKRVRVRGYIFERLQLDNQAREAQLALAVDFAPAWTDELNGLRDRLSYLLATDDVLNPPAQRISLNGNCPTATRELILSGDLTITLTRYPPDQIRLPRTQRGRNRLRRELPSKIQEATHALQAAMAAEKEQTIQGSQPEETRLPQGLLLFATRRAEAALFNVLNPFRPGSHRRISATPIHR